MEFLNIPIFDDDVYKMIFRFIINIIFLTIIIKFLYYKKTKRKDYVFTYFMISIIIFFLCFTLKKLDLGLGMALGLFAIFGIIRYRTDAIKIKEMTYLFVVIGTSVINSLSNKNMSYIELILENIIIVVSIFIIERVWFLNHEISKKIIYENIENIKPENYEILKADIEARTGLTINKINIGEINFLRDTAQLEIFYYNGF